MSEASGGEPSGGISNQLATLVPSFDPSKDDLQVYQQKVQLVLSVWPANRVSELVTRLILNTTGSAFAKLQLHHEELGTNDAKSVQKLIEYLGGQWGKTSLEKRYADAEKALFQCSQQADESTDSYLARADVLWSKLKTQKLQIDDLQAYITLRGALLSSDDKKRIILDSDSSLEGKLTIVRVQEAVRLLGTSFFQEMTGLGKKLNKAKAYDSANLVAEDSMVHGDHDDQVHTALTEEWTEDDILEVLLAEGDEDAVFITDFESAASEILQSDDDIASAYSTYVEARRKLNEKFRSRGFWPISKGKGKMGKGKFKGKPMWGSRKSLQQRILESNCRICGKKGHWRNECPNKTQGNTSGSTAAAATVSMAQPASDADLSLPEEFLILPEAPTVANKDILSNEPSNVQVVFYGEEFPNEQKVAKSTHMGSLREKIRGYVKGKHNFNFGVKTLVHRIEQKLRQQAAPSAQATEKPTRTLRFDDQATEKPTRILRSDDVRSHSRQVSCPPDCPTVTDFSNPMPAKSPASTTADTSEVLFATHDTWGILDTGATKTVIGNDHLKDFLNNLDPKIKPHVKRSTCDITFRFGNQGTLKASHAVVIPVCGMWLKVAVVKGATPFLVSNTLLRALGALIDTQNHELIIAKHQAKIPLKLTPKGLYLIDMNHLTAITPLPKNPEEAAETFAQDTWECDPKHVHAAAQDQPIHSESQKCVTNNTKSQCHATGSVGAKEVKRQLGIAGPSNASESPVMKSHAANPNKSLFCNQDIRAKSQTITAASKHEQLDPAPFQSPGQHSDSSRSGANWSSDAERTQGDHHDLWKSPLGKEVRGDLVNRPKLDPLVPGALCLKHQDRPPENDQVHSDEDRRVGNRDPSAISQEPSKVPGNQAKGQSHDGSKPGDCRGTDTGKLRDDVRSRMGATTRTERGDHCSPGQNAEPRECHAKDATPDAECHASPASDACSSPRICSGGMGRSLEQLDGHDSHSNWTLQAGEMDEFCPSSPNKESIRFWKLVNKFEKELQTCAKIYQSTGPKIDLLEVFCHEDSTLTSQVIQMGGTACRHGHSQGDLMTAEGRHVLFSTLLRRCPKHVWLSPVCGPWGAWSMFNSLRSLESWDKVHAERWKMLIQVALCLVICRHQHRCNQHAHWEQPRGSLMLKLPYLQEVYRYMLVTYPDMCKAGNLKDPENGKPIKKAMQINTTSKRVFEGLQNLKCPQDHEHQVIEGSTKLLGMPVPRSQFTERYTRKFSRMLAKMFIKNKFPCEKPVGSIADPVLMVMDALCAEVNASSSQERPAKRLKKTPTAGVKKPAATGGLAQTGVSKRRKSQTVSKEVPEDQGQEKEIIKEKIHEIVTRIENLLPRVGKKQIDSPLIMQELHAMFPEMIIKKVVACKGTDRRWGPPKDVNISEAPYRRSLMKLRENHDITWDQQWEKYDMLSNRQVIRKSPACRVNITMFAAVKPPEPDSHEPVADTSPMPGDAMHDSAPEESDSVSIERNQPDCTGHESNDEKLQHAPESVDLSPASAPNSPSTEEEHGPRFKALPREEQIMLKRAHQNLCHPSAEQLCQVLKSQGCRPELSQAVHDMKCATCTACQKPKIARPSTFKDALDFNDKVFIDGITWKSKSGQSYHFYHVLDQATNFHVAIPAPNRTAEHAIAKVSEAWFNWAGPPNALVMDSATEFTSEAFQGFLQKHDVRDIVTSPHAHWQNGRCERHGQILQNMLNRLDQDQEISSYSDLQQALIQCTHAKNSLSIRKGYAPEVLVFGKQSKLPGSTVSCEELSSHASANREDGHGIEFRQKLALRERARIAFHRADNDMALRRAILRRSRPDRQGYQPGEWIMMWQPQSENQGYWFGPLKVVQQEKNLSIWATKGGRLHRRAPEHVRPVCAAEARQISEDRDAEPPPPSAENPTGNLSMPESPSETPIPVITPNNPPIEIPSTNDDSSQSQEQPDDEPEGDNHEGSETHDNQPTYLDTPIPNIDADDDLVTTHLLCCDDNMLTVDPTETPCAWRFEVEVPKSVSSNLRDNESPDEILLASTEKKQRTEVKLSMLNPEEKIAFEEAKQTEIKNWLATGTVSKILRSKLAPEQILRCRWLLVWKDRGEESKKSESSTEKSGTKLQTHKPKARLVVLGYLDPNLTEVPRDSPTLGRQSKMLLLQLIVSHGWSLGSFDIKAAFLQGKPQDNRVMGLEPVPELAAAMKLQPNEVCKLDKSAYGLIDAPFLWFQTLCEELKNLGFVSSPFDPCMYVLRHPETGKLSGVLGVHVDDGIHGGDEFFHQQIQKLEKKYPFGSKKSRAFTFTGIDMQQLADNSIQLSQAKYVNSIQPISLTPIRKTQEESKVTEEERHNLRGLVGSLQYAAVHTRPDLSSSLSLLQSQINTATVSTLLTANKVLHNAKKHSDVNIKIQPIPLKDVRFVAFSDASFASKSKPESHAGMIILATHKDIIQNKSCVISPLSWGTKKIQRIVTSTLSAETSALSTSLDQLTWIRLYWAWLLDSKIHWQKPEQITELPPAISIPTYKANPQDIAITDCKSLYDLTTRTAIPNCQEFRTQLLARSIKDILDEGIKLHWVHSGAQLADALTKMMDAHFLRETLRVGKYCLHDAEEVLKNRASARNRLRWLRTANDQMCT